MYSGTTLTRASGRIMGAHQKIDRVARRHLRLLDPKDKMFPGIRMILQFEGRNGPDGIKLKSPAKDEPWHYYNPFDENDTELIGIIQDHYANLVKELRAGNKERAAFEASWLAHAIVDGLTPAHHYPYEEKLEELRGGASKETRTTTKAKLVMPGETSMEKIRNNWKMWGGKGLFTTHGTFELGVASLITPLKLTRALPTPGEIDKFQGLGLTEYFKQQAKIIAEMDMYHRYYKKGWTPRLASQARAKLAPKIVRTVTLAWHAAVLEAEKSLVKLP